MEETTTPKTRRRSVRKRKPREICKHSSGANLYVTDELEIERKCNVKPGLKKGAIIRELVAAALRAERLKAVGKDETMWAVVNTQKMVVGEGIAPLVALLEDQRAYLEDHTARTHEEYASIERLLRSIDETLNILMKGFDRILQNIVMIRALIWHYIFFFYYQVMVAAGKKLTSEQVQKNYEARVRDIKIEAAKERMLCGEKAVENTVKTVAQKLVSDADNPVPTLPANQRPPTTSS